MNAPLLEMCSRDSPERTGSSSVIWWHQTENSSGDCLQGSRRGRWLSRGCQRLDSYCVNWGKPQTEGLQRWKQSYGMYLTQLYKRSPLKPRRTAPNSRCGCKHMIAGPRGVSFIGGCNRLATGMLY